MTESVSDARSDESISQGFPADKPEHPFSLRNMSQSGASPSVMRQNTFKRRELHVRTLSMRRLRRNTGFVCFSSAPARLPTLDQVCSAGVDESANVCRTK